MNSKLNCVLLIDDDEPTNFLNRLIVEDSGYAEYIKVATGGQDALDFITNTSLAANGDKNYPCPDLIILDINMPAMNGWEFLDHYKKLELRQKGKGILVMLTTSLFPEDILRAENTPEISVCESKPLSAETFKTIFTTYFENKN